MSRLRTALLGAATLAVGLSTLPATAADTADPLELLVYSGTYSFRHESIAPARAAFAALDESPEFEVTLTEDPGRIDAAGLAGYDVLVLLNSGGDYPFPDSAKRELMQWRAAGGGVVGIHTPVDGSTAWPEYGRMLGATFHSHPHTGVAKNVVEQPDHPLVAHLPETFSLNEEYYRWQFDPRENVRVLTSLDRDSINTPPGYGLTYEAKQPLTWCHDDGGRTFYTAYGHNAATYSDPGFWTMVQQALRWTGGRIEADCSPTTPRNPDRLQAEKAEIALGRVEHSTQKGAELAVTDLLHNGYLRFRDVDLTGVEAVTLNLSVESSPQHQSWRPTVPRPAAGGTVHLRLDQVVADDPAATCGFAGPCAPGTDLATAEVAPGAPGWKTVRIEIPPQTGRHDLFVALSEELSAQFAGARLFLPDVMDTRTLMTIDWVQLERG